MGRGSPKKRSPHDQELVDDEYRESDDVEDEYSEDGEYSDEMEEEDVEGAEPRAAASKKEPRARGAARSQAKKGKARSLGVRSLDAAQEEEATYSDEEEDEK